jgi:hypothetical protein
MYDTVQAGNEEVESIPTFKWSERTIRKTSLAFQIFTKKNREKPVNTLNIYDYYDAESIIWGRKCVAKSLKPASHCGEAKSLRPSAPLESKLFNQIKIGAAMMRAN